MELHVISKIDVVTAHESIPVLTSVINTLGAVELKHLSGCANLELVKITLDLLKSERQTHKDLLSACKSRREQFDKSLLHKIQCALHSAKQGAASYERAKQITIDSYNQQADALKAKGFSTKQIEQIISYPHSELAEMAQAQNDRLSLIDKINAFLTSPDYDTDLLAGTIFDQEAA
jgi:hypothetical protein